MLRVSICTKQMLITVRCLCFSLPLNHFNESTFRYPCLLLKMSQWVNVNQNIFVTCNVITAIRQISAEACGGTAVESNLKLRPVEGRVAEDYGVLAVDHCYLSNWLSEDICYNEGGVFIDSDSLGRAGGQVSCFMEHFGQTPFFCCFT